MYSNFDLRGDQDIVSIYIAQGHFKEQVLTVGFTCQVVGPPGTGKTDVAVQIISNIYHNFPEQRTLLVTHSNQVGLTKVN